MSPHDPIRWCCPGFEFAFRQAGERGFGVFADTSASPVLFVLQHRALDPGATVPTYSGHMSVITQVGITYCPWCGRELLKWYKKSLPELYRGDLIVSLR